MQDLTIQSMKTMQYLPRIDRKILRHAASWMLAVATSMIGVAVYA